MTVKRARVCNLVGVTVLSLACNPSSIPVGYDHPIDSGSTGTGGSVVGVADAAGGDASAWSGRAGEVGGSGGAVSASGGSGGTTGGATDSSSGGGGESSTAPAFWLVNMYVHDLCDRGAAIGWPDPELENPSQIPMYWSPTVGLATRTEPSAADGSDLVGIAIQDDCSFTVGRFQHPDRSSAIVRWDDQGRGMVIGQSPLEQSPPNQFSFPLNTVAFFGQGGQVVAFSSTSAGSLEPITRPQLWTPNGTTTIPAPSGFSSFDLIALSADGRAIFGQARNNPVQEGQPMELTRWTQSTGSVVLPGLTNCAVTHANQNGSEAVGFCVDPPYRMFGWREGVGRFDLGEPVGAGFAVPHLATADGSTVTGTYSGYPGGIFVWSSADGFQIVATSGATDVLGAGGPAGMSGDGSTIVGFVAPDEGPATNVRWSRSTGLLNLEPLSDVFSCEVSGLSADGDIASGTCTDARENASYSDTGVIWGSDGKIHTVEALLTAAGVNLGGAKLLSAHVHRGGRLLWGTAQLPNNEPRDYIARLP